MLKGALTERLWQNIYIWQAGHKIGLAIVGLRCLKEVLHGQIWVRLYKKWACTAASVNYLLFYIYIYYNYISTCYYIWIIYTYILKLIWWFCWCVGPNSVAMSLAELSSPCSTGLSLKCQWFIDRKSHYFQINQKKRQNLSCMSKKQQPSNLTNLKAKAAERHIYFHGFEMYNLMSLCGFGWAERLNLSGYSLW